MTTTKLHSYTNGNYQVDIYSDGTKIRQVVNVPAPEFPESIDLKITDWCDAGCPWCHEKSTVRGSHGKVADILAMTDSLPAGVELAIGGGDPLKYPNLLFLLERIKSRGLIANITVNSRHLSRHSGLINQLRRDQLIYGLGISYSVKHADEIAKISDNNTVLHVIAGIDKVSDILKLSRHKILVLGYKDYGLGGNYAKKHDITKNLASWNYWIVEVMKRHHISFDNLAIKQLRIKERITDQAWSDRYMGDDGLFTMYIDGVKNEYARSSTSSRVPCGFLTIPQMFAEVRKNKMISLEQINV